MSLRGLLLVSALGLSGIAQAQDAASELLLRVSEAARTANYQGVVIYRGDDLLETFRVAHRYQDGEERERVQSLSGEVREVLKHDDKVICILPKDQQLTVNRPTPKGLFPGLSAERVAQIASVYELREIGERRVAGRICRGLVVQPRDQFRYGYEIWADAESAVPLKVSLIGQRGRVLEQMFFTQVEFPVEIPDSAFETAFNPDTMRRLTQSSAPEISAAAAALVAEKPELATAPAAPAAPAPTPRSEQLQMPQLPPGFKVTMRDVRTLAGDRGVVEHVVLSDGLSAISVFRSRELVPGAKTFSGVSQMGAVTAYGRVVGRMQITVVGEAPQETVRMIGDSFPEASELPAGEAAPPAAPLPSPAQ